MSKEVVKHETGQLVSDVIPDYLKGYEGATGTENIDSQDVSIPRLKLGQAMSEEVKSGAVKDGDLFHSITKQILIPKGKSGLPCAHVRRHHRHHRAKAD